ncbi:MAG: sensor histidine kinase [Candidatus Phosphoribacter sp.]|nr:sensor histidine kinase [Actinomycetales bacterium]
MSLFWRLFLGSVLTLLVATLILAFTPVTVSARASTDEIIVLIVGLAVIYVVHALIIRNALGPLAELRQALTDLDSPRPDRTVPVRRSDEIGAVAAAYNLMLERLDAEREESVRASLSAQEAERARVSGELHDAVGQSLTVLLLRLEMLGRAVPAELRDDVAALSEVVRHNLEEVRAISARLRPGVLADLGLPTALKALAADLRRHAGIHVHVRMPSGWVGSDELDLVIYRVVQEALTNVVRHAEGTKADVDVVSDERGLTVTISDNGVGIAGVPGTGMMGMGERARLVKGRLDHTSEPGLGTTVTLTIPRTTEGVRQ